MNISFFRMYFAIECVSIWRVAYLVTVYSLEFAPFSSFGELLRFLS